MPAPKLHDFNERRKSAIEAKKALAAKFLAQPAPDDPIMIARREEQQRLAEAREARAAERRAAKEAEAARLREQDEVRKAAEAERLAEIARREAEKAAEAIRMAAERKAIRDAKYAGAKGKRWKALRQAVLFEKKHQKTFIRFSGVVRGRSQSPNGDSSGP